MYYFKFPIPTNSDGTRVSYSPDWFGTMPKCPQNVKVLLYNDKEGYGIAKCEENFVPPEVEVLDEKIALALVDEVKEEATVFKGETLANRWNPEVVIEDKIDTEATITESVVVSKKAVFCPICHQFIMWLPENIVAKTITLTCPAGHKVNLSGVTNG